MVSTRGVDGRVPCLVVPGTRTFLADGVLYRRAREGGYQSQPLTCQSRFKDSLLLPRRCSCRDVDGRPWDIVDVAIVMFCRHRKRLKKLSPWTHPEGTPREVSPATREGNVARSTESLDLTPTPNPNHNPILKRTPGAWPRLRQLLPPLPPLSSRAGTWLAVSPHLCRQLRPARLYKHSTETLGGNGYPLVPQDGVAVQEVSSGFGSEGEPRGLSP